MKRGTNAQPANLRDYGNLRGDASTGSHEVNLKDLAGGPAGPANNRRPSLFHRAFQFDDEIKAEEQKQKSKTSGTISNPNTGQLVSKQSVAHHVINDAAQWNKLKEQMRQNRAVSGMTLKHNLDEMLQNRVVDIESTPTTSGAGHRAPRRTSIADFATTLILGEDKPPGAAGTGPQPARQEPWMQGYGDEHQQQPHQQQQSPRRAARRSSLAEFATSLFVGDSQQPPSSPLPSGGSMFHSHSGGDGPADGEIQTFSLRSADAPGTPHGTSVSHGGTHVVGGGGGGDNSGGGYTVSHGGTHTVGDYAVSHGGTHTVGDYTVSHGGTHTVSHGGTHTMSNHQYPAPSDDSPPDSPVDSQSYPPTYQGPPLSPSRGGEYSQQSHPMSPSRGDYQQQGHPMSPSRGDYQGRPADYRQTEYQQQRTDFRQADYPQQGRQAYDQQQPLSGWGHASASEFQQQGRSHSQSRDEGGRQRGLSPSRSSDDVQGGRRGHSPSRGSEADRRRGRSNSPSTGPRQRSGHSPTRKDGSRRTREHSPSRTHSPARRQGETLQQRLLASSSGVPRSPRSQKSSAPSSTRSPTSARPKVGMTVDANEPAECSVISNSSSQAPASVTTSSVSDMDSMPVNGRLGNVDEHDNGEDGTETKERKKSKKSKKKKKSSSSSRHSSSTHQSSSRRRRGSSGEDELRTSAHRSHRSRSDSMG